MTTLTRFKKKRNHGVVEFIFRTSDLLSISLDEHIEADFQVISLHIIFGRHRIVGKHIVSDDNAIKHLNSPDLILGF